MLVADTPETRPTNASIDRRVEKVEDAVHKLELSHIELDRKIDRLEMGQTHMKEILSSRFSTIESGQMSQANKTDAVGKKLDSFMDEIHKMVADSLKTAGDIEATPVGRLVKEELDKLDTGRENNSKRIDALEKKFYIFMGALIFGSFAFTPVFNLFLPVLRKLFGIE